MKVGLYARNMNLNRKIKTMQKYKKNDFLGNKTVKNLFPSPNVL